MYEMNILHTGFCNDDKRSCVFFIYTIKSGALRARIGYNKYSLAYFLNWYNEQLRNDKILQPIPKELYDMIEQTAVAEAL